MGESNTTAKKITISVDEVYDAGDVYNYSDNNTSLSYDTCVCMCSLTVTFLQKDNRNGMLCTPNTWLINATIVQPESPIALKKKKPTLSKVESNETSLSIGKKTPLVASLGSASDDYELKKKRERKVQL